MKRIILLSAVCFLNMGLAFAQTHVFERNVHTKVRTYVNARKLPSRLLQVPNHQTTHLPNHQANTGSQYRQVGAYWGDNYNPQGYGLPQYPGQLRVATVIPKELFRPYEGCQIVALRTALSQKIDNLRFFVASIDNEGNILDEIVSSSFISANFGWNEADITPLTIETSSIAGYVVGYEYTQFNNRSVFGGYAAECYPISMIKCDMELPMLVHGQMDYGYDWYRVDTEGSTMSIQCIVKGNGFSDQDFALNYIDTGSPLLRQGSNMEGILMLQNIGTQGTTGYEGEVELDGHTLATFNGEAESGAFMTTKFVIGEALDAGSHELTARLTHINGEPLVTSQPWHQLPHTFSVYGDEDVQERQKYVVEEFTSTASQYAPLGTNLLSAMTKHFDDVCIVSLHESYTGPDTLASDHSRQLIDLLNWQQTPSAAFNRVDLGIDTETSTFGINAATGYDTQYPATYAKRFHQQMEDNSLAALATLDIAATVDGQQLTTAISGHGSQRLHDLLGRHLRLTVYLTEDSIASPQIVGNTTDTGYIHNHVARCMLTDTRGDDLQWTGDGTFSQTYQTELPAHWSATRLNVVALLHLMPAGITYDYSHMQVSNACTVRPQVITAISQTSVADSQPVEWYSIDGTRLDAPRRGINIVRLSTGQTRKVILQ